MLNSAELMVHPFSFVMKYWNNIRNGYREEDGDGDEMRGMNGFSVVLGHLGPTRTLGNAKLVDMKNLTFLIFHDLRWL